MSDPDDVDRARRTLVAVGRAGHPDAEADPVSAVCQVARDQEQILRGIYALAEETGVPFTKVGALIEAAQERVSRRRASWLTVLGFAALVGVCVLLAVSKGCHSPDPEPVVLQPG